MTNTSTLHVIYPLSIWSALFLKLTRTSWSNAGALCIPAGTHFLCEGRDSNLPSKFHKPSSSKGVRWTFIPGRVGGDGGSSSSSFTWPFRASELEDSRLRPEIVIFSLNNPRIKQIKKQTNPLILLTMTELMLCAVCFMPTDSKHFFLFLIHQ